MKIFIIIFSFFIGISFSVHAEDTENIKLGYEIYAGGLHGVSASLGFYKKEDDRYRITTNVNTRGVIGFIYPLEAYYRSFGKVENDRVIPEKYESESKTRSSVRSKILEYDEKGSVVTKITGKNGRTNATDVTGNELSKGAIDFLAVWQAMMLKADRKNDCSQNIPVFDGKRRFNLVFKNMGEDFIEKNRYSVFSGKAVKCLLDIVPLGERPKNSWFWHRSGKDEKQMPIKIWLAKVKENTPAVPVKMEIDSHGFGAIVSHLSSSSFNTVE